MNRPTTLSSDMILSAFATAARPVSRRCALMSGVAGAVLLGLGVPSWAADCTSTGQTTFTTDPNNTELCLSPDGNHPATTTGSYAIAIGSGTQATSSAGPQGVIDFRTTPNGIVVLPNSVAGAPDLVSGTAIGQNTVVGPAGGVGIGYNNTAGTGGFMGVAVGANNAASGGFAVAVGQANIASGMAAVAQGTANQATGSRAVAIGRQNYAFGDQSIAQGFVASAYGTNAIALGNTAVAGVASSTTAAINDVAIGNVAQATGGSSLAFGDGTVASASNAIAVGPGTSAGEAYGTAIGQGASVRGAAGVGGDIAIGRGATASEATASASAIALGAGSQASTDSGGSPIALGYNARAVNTQNTAGSPIAIGFQANATAAAGTSGSPVAIGDRASATGADAIAIGGHAGSTGSSATADQSTAIGQSVTATGVGAVAIGLNTNATTASDLAIGNGASATGGSSVALGTGASARGGKAVSIGAGNTAIGDGAVAIGDPSTASGTGAFAGGADNTVYGEGAVGIGNNNTVNASNTPADGTVALGDGNTAVGQGSVALGFRSTADGIGSLAFGDSASATHAGGVALGSGAVDGAAVQRNDVYRLATSGPITLGYNNATGVNAGTVSVGSGSGSNAYRQIQNVADGSAAHDAVTMEQLASVASQANGAITPLQNSARLAVQYTADGNGNPTSALDLTRGGNLGPVSVTGLAPATTATGAVALGQMPLQYATANAPTTANPGTASNDATLVGANAGAVALHNLSAGSLAAGSTDAATAGQVFAGNASTASILGGGATYNTATGQVSAPSYAIRGTTYGDVGSAFGAVDNSLGALQAKSGGFASDNTSGAADARAPGRDALAGGFGSAATGAGSTVLGNGASDNGNAGSTVLGMRASIGSNTPGSNVALGQGSVASSGAASNYAAYGLGSPQSAIGEVSVGSAGATRRITNVAAGRDAADAVNVAQLEGAMGAAPVQYATAANPTVANPGVASNDVTLVGARAGAVSLHNLAAGTLAATSTDAVNGGQLYAAGASTASAFGGGAVYDTATGKVTAPAYTIAGRTYADVGGALGALDGSVNGGGGIKYFHANSALADSAATGTDALAAGGAALASATDGTALGANASSTGVNSVALGAGSSDGGLANVVSVGAVGAERRIVNVAAGTLAAGSTDAATAGQVFAGNASTAAILGGGATYNTATGQVSAPSYAIRGTTYGDVGSAFGAVDNSLGALQAKSGGFASDNTSGAADARAPGRDALAGGFGSAATGAGSTVLGNGASDNGNAGSTVLGMRASIGSNTPGSNVALGQGSVASSGAASNYAAYGLGSPQSAIGEVSVGSAGATRRITNVAAGRDAADAVNVAQLEGAMGAAPVQYATAANPTVANPGVASNDVTLVGARAGAVSLHNLAAGTLAATSTDAVNGGQLYAAGASTASAFGGGAVYDTATGKVTAPAYTIAGRTYADVGGALGALDGSVNGGGGIKYFHANSALADSAATGTDALAAGGAALASAADGTALGANASSTGVNSVALGAGSSDGGLANVVSVGAVGAERRIVNVAAGTLAAGSTDAATAGQVFAGNASIASILGGGATYDPATGRVTSPTYTVNGTGYTTVAGAVGALDGAVSGGGIKYFHANSTLADASASGQNAVAMGPAALASGTGGVALGNGAASTGTNSVALGAGSSDGGAANVVSVGAVGAERRIVNVAAGTLAAGSTDAATAGQVYAGGSSIAAILGGGSTYNATTGTVTAPTYTVGDASYGTVGGALTALDGSVNGGGGIKYFHTNSTLADASATGTDAIAVGPAAAAAGGMGVAIGKGASSTGTNSVALGAGSSDGGQADVVSVGAVGAERRITNVAAGTLAAGSTDAVNGGQLYQTNQQVASLGHTAVQYDTGANGRTSSTISLSSDAGGPVVIHNLGAGTAATDAANVGQLRTATANAIQYDTVGGVRSNTVSFAGGQPGTVALQNVGPGVNGTDAVNLNQLNAAAGSALGQAQGYTDTRINNLAALTEQAINGARSEAAAGTASALAASGLRYDDRPGKTAVAGAAGYYHGQAGLAFGLGHTANDGHLRFNAAVTVSPTMERPEVGAVVGGSWSFN